MERRQTKGAKNQGESRATAACVFKLLLIIRLRIRGGGRSGLAMSLLRLRGDWLRLLAVRCSLMGLKPSKKAAPRAA